MKINFVLPELEAADQKEAFEKMAEVIAKEHEVDVGDLVNALVERERTRPTALERTGVAIPHARLAGITEFVVLFARSKKGVDFKAEDGRPSHLFFLIVGPEEAPGDYLRLLARIARLCHDVDFRANLMKAESAEELLSIITERDEKY